MGVTTTTTATARASTPSPRPHPHWPVVGARGICAATPARRTSLPPPIDRPCHHRRVPTTTPTPATRRDALLAATTATGLALVVRPPLLLAQEDLSSSSSSSSSSSLSSSLAASLEARVREYALSNGLKLLVVPRPEDGPVLSVTAHHNVGAWDEPDGQTGYAHLLEHMMFKGTPRTGNIEGSWRRERAALERVDDAFEAVRSARREAGLSVEGYSIGGGNGSNGSNGNNGNNGPSAAPIPDRVAKLEAELARCVADAAQYSRQEQGYGARLQAAGAVGLNAATSHDETRYFCSLPAQKLELWMSLEGERLAAPVFRQLHEEKKVVAEERRARVDASPRGRYVAAMAERAFLRSAAVAEAGAPSSSSQSSSSSSSSPIPPTRTLSPGDNPYGRPVLGYREDLAAVGRRELAAFFRARYTPANAVLAVVGDVAAATGAAAATSDAACDRVAAMAERYFGVWGSEGESGAVAPTPLPLLNEPLPRFGGPADAEFVARSASGPSVYLAFPRPSLAAGGQDAVALEAACDALASGRASRFGRALVRPGLALGASLVPGWPGDKHAGACLAGAVPPEGQAADERACRRLIKRMQDEADALVEKGITEAELARVKKGAAVGLLSATTSNAGLAGALAAYEATTPGGWRALLSELGELEALTREQVRSAAERTFGGGARFVGVMLPAAAAGEGTMRGR